MSNLNTLEFLHSFLDPIRERLKTTSTPGDDAFLAIKAVVSLIVLVGKEDAITVDLIQRAIKAAFEDVESFKALHMGKKL